MSLKEELVQAVALSANSNVTHESRERVAQGNLTRDEDPVSHFCAYFLPYNSETKQVMFGHHKKSGKWISPGGHIDKGELLLETLNREIDEELGVRDFFTEKPEPFLLTITNIDRDPRLCKKHFDVWHLMETDGNNFNIDMTEYYDVKWLTIPEAQELTNDEANQAALKVVAQM